MELFVFFRLKKFKGYVFYLLSIQDYGSVFERTIGRFHYTTTYTNRSVADSAISPCVVLFLASCYPLSLFPKVYAWKLFYRYSSSGSILGPYSSMISNFEYRCLSPSLEQEWKRWIWYLNAMCGFDWKCSGIILPVCSIDQVQGTFPNLVRSRPMGASEFDGSILYKDL